MWVRLDPIGSPERMPGSPRSMGALASEESTDQDAGTDARLQAIHATKKSRGIAPTCAPMIPSSQCMIAETTYIGPPCLGRQGFQPPGIAPSSRPFHVKQRLDSCGPSRQFRPRSPPEVERGGSGRSRAECLELVARRPGIAFRTIWPGRLST